MSLLGGLIALADNLTDSFQLKADVAYWAFVSSDAAGQASYAPVVQLKAIYVRKMKQVRKFDGEQAISNAQVTFLKPMVINEFDKIVTPVAGVLDLSIAAREAAQPIVGTDGFVDGSNAPIATEIYLG